LHVLIKLGDSIVHPCAAYNESEDSPGNVRPQDKIEGAGAVAAAVIEAQALLYHHCFRISHTVLARTILSRGVTQPLPLTRDGAKVLCLPHKTTFDTLQDTSKVLRLPRKMIMMVSKVTRLPRKMQRIF